MKRTPHPNQFGFTLVELMVAVAISVVIGASINYAWKLESQRIASQRYAGAWKPYYQALQDYVQDNKQVLVAGGAVTGVVDPLAPTIAELRALNKLSTSYPLTIPGNGGTPIYRLALIPSGCLPNVCDIGYYVGTTVPELNSDGSVNERLLSNTAQYYGATAGYSTTLAPGTIAGLGGWTYPNPSGSVAGLFGIYTTYSQSGNSAFVRIADNRDPALAGNLTVANGITGSTLTPTLTVATGASCSSASSGAMAKDSAGVILSCQSGTWSKALGGGTGMTAVYSPLAGKTISCSGTTNFGTPFTATAMIDASGYPFVRLIASGSSTGFVSGYSTSRYFTTHSSSESYVARFDLNGIVVTASGIFMNTESGTPITGSCGTGWPAI
jgi:prepilin-type N-terminal cleavage/methylation domain-containing protein